MMLSVHSTVIVACIIGFFTSFLSCSVQQGYWREHLHFLLWYPLLQLVLPSVAPLKLFVKVTDDFLVSKSKGQYSVFILQHLTLLITHLWLDSFSEGIEGRTPDFCPTLLEVSSQYFCWYLSSTQCPMVVPLTHSALWTSLILIYNYLFEDLI